MVEPDILTGVSCPDSEGQWEVWGKTESWFPIQPPKTLVNLFRQGEKVKISNFNGLFFPKGKFVELQTLTGVDTEMLWEVWGKTEWYFPIQPPENFENLFGVGDKIKISNFIAYFFLKAKWVEPETFTGVSCLGTERLWKVWDKIEWCFPIQPAEKLENFF